MEKIGAGATEAGAGGSVGHYEMFPYHEFDDDALDERGGARCRVVSRGTYNEQ